MVLVLPTHVRNKYKSIMDNISIHFRTPKKDGKSCLKKMVENPN